jgi:16S rRNA A1518/A1519 N6-dimethyltransferase RsmA/KsgA/DIM1 with predicted DNA glycosylase/AP lyase activity
VEVELLDAVFKSFFYPPPEVDSVIVRLKPWAVVPFEVEKEEFFRRLIRLLFTQRNKKLSNALIPFIKSTLRMTKEDAEKLVCAIPFREKRVRELSPEAFGELANAFTR